MSDALLVIPAYEYAIRKKKYNIVLSYSAIAANGNNQNLCNGQFRGILFISDDILPVLFSFKIFRGI